MISYISAATVPIIICVIIIYGMLKKQQVFNSFLCGAKSGLITAAEVLPAFVALITAVAMLRASGALDILCGFLSPVLDFLHFPRELVPLAVMRPISGSGATAVLNDILNTYSPDSFTGKCASVMMGSSETTLYTITVYFGSVGIKNIRHTFKAAILADITAVAASFIFVKIFLF